MTTLRTRELKIDSCLDNKRDDTKSHSYWTYCPLYDATMDRCDFYDQLTRDVDIGKKPKYCRVTRVIIEEEI